MFELILGGIVAALVRPVRRGRIAVGLLLEGETMLVLGAFMAHRGYLSLPIVIVIGWLVAFTSDQFFFWLGRTQGHDRKHRITRL